MNKFIVFVSCILLVLLFLLYYLKFEIKDLEILLVIAYVMSLYQSYKLNKSINITFLFLICIGIFNLGKIYLHLIENQEWWKGNFFVNFEFSLNTIRNILLIIFLTIIGILVSIIFNKRKREESRNYLNDANLEKVSIFLMILSIIPLLIRLFYEIKIIQIVGYIGIYNGEFYKYPIPFYLKGWKILYTYSYYIFIMSYPSKNKYIKYGILFFLLNIIEVFKGGRTQLVVNIFVIISYYIILYNVKLKIKLKYLFLGLSMVVFLQKISKLRVNIDMNLSILESIKEFISDQGTSLLILGFNFEQLHNYKIELYRFFFAPILDLFVYLKYPELFKNQNLTILTKISNLSMHLSNSLNQEYYKKGFGVGGNYIAEIYNLGGLWLVFFMGIIVGYITLNFASFIKKSRKNILIGIIFLKNLYISPRGSILPSFYEFVLALGFYIIIRILLLFLLKVQEK